MHFCIYHVLSGFFSAALKKAIQSINKRKSICLLRVVPSKLHDNMISMKSRGKQQLLIGGIVLKTIENNTSH